MEVDVGGGRQEQPLRIWEVTDGEVQAVTHAGREVAVGVAV